MNDERNSLQKQKKDRREALARDRRELLSVPPEKALDLVAEHDYPVTLIQSMAEEDFYYLVHAIGPEDAGPVLALASNSQWEYLLDMEIWQGDRLALHDMTLWLHRLLQADADRFTHWITREKQDEFVFYLFRNLELHIREYDQDPGEVADDFATEDQTHYTRLRPYPEERKPDQERRDLFLTDLLKRISVFDYLQYRDLLLASSAVIPAEAEEELLRLRNVRLSEKGFLPFDEAVGVYQALKVDDLHKRPRKAPVRSHRVDDTHPMPAAVQNPGPDANRLARALARIQDAAILQQLQAELAALCNQVITADRQRVREKEGLGRIVTKVGDYISIGLEKVHAEAADPTPYSDDQLIQKHLLADIFRVGYGCALALKWKAEKWRRSSWFTNAGLPVSFWGEKWMGVLGGLLIKKPLYFDDYAQGVLYRDFARLDDIRHTQNTLDAIIAFDDLLALIDLEPVPIPPPGLLSYQNLLLTAWANHHLGMDTRGRRYIPLSREQFQTFFGELWVDAAPPRRISRTMRELFLGWLADRSGLADFEIAERMAHSLEQLFTQIEAELGRVDAGDIDPRFTRQFILQPAD